jgi:formate C-acetyltransferase
MSEAFQGEAVPDGTVATRGQKLWERMLGYRQKAKLSLARAKLVLASYRETEGQLPSIRRARAFENVVTKIPIYIEDDDLLAGAFAAAPMDFEWYPEFAVDQELAPDNLRNFLDKGDTEGEAREIIDYFRDRCLQSSFLSRIGEEKRRFIAEVCEEGAWVCSGKLPLNIDVGYHSVNYEKAIHKGFLGVLAEAQEELRATPIVDEASYQKVHFLRGLEIVLRAGIQYSMRFAALARQLSRKAAGRREAELGRIAAACEWVPAHPARSFFEALQTALLLHILMHLESRSQESPGRMDQYLYPFYLRDLEEGRLTREEALEILECLRVKMSTLRLFNGVGYNEIISGEAQYHNITLGGQTADGEDATNELSYLFLEAALRTRTPHPTLSIRYHDKISKDFMLQGLALVRVGLGFPAFFNDGSAIPWLLSLGVPLEIARGCCVSGCVHHTIPGQSSPLEPFFISIAKCLELALHDGFDPLTGKQLGPRTGGLESCGTYDQVVDGFKKQVRYFSELGGVLTNEQRVGRVNIAPTMLSSAFVDDCIRAGQSCLGNGARYILLGQIAVGVIDAADSLAAIKKCVFEEGTIGKRDLLDALDANFAGREELRRSLVGAPKYGNDDDYVDAIAAELYDWWRKMVSEIDGAYGLKYLPAPYSISIHGAAGKRVGAIPSGRLAGVALADGSVSPTPGADGQGPTAVLNSAGKIDQVPLFGTLLNMKFHPTSLKTQEDLEKLLALIKTYFGYGGKHVQFNVVDSKTLREAQAHPERHPHLVVRVAGYSALFNELHRSIQDEIISRTEFMTA